MMVLVIIRDQKESKSVIEGFQLKKVALLIVYLKSTGVNSNHQLLGSF